MAASSILVIDDEPAIRQVLSSYIADAGYLVESAGNGTEALEKLSHGDFDIAICDIKMPDISGIEVVKRVHISGADTAFIMVTAFASINVAIEAMQAGAYDFIVKPIQEEDILHKIALITDVIRLRNENKALRKIVLGDDRNFCRLPSASYKEIERLVLKVAPTDNTILITGESGTGKGLIASAIHKESLRQNAAFIPVNCGAIPENLIESELFGHVKGAFTGAHKSKNGLFLEAQNGTIFLDEIGELSAHSQVKLLHVIEGKKVRPVGSDIERPMNVRIVAATNRNLEEMVQGGEFREDLYFRLNVFQIHVPPLRGRTEDVSELIRFCLNRESKKLAAGKNFTIDVDAEEMLLNYDWPGNIRALENVISRATTLAEDMRVTVADLPPQVTKVTPAMLVTDITGFSTRNLRDQVRTFEYKAIKKAVEDAGNDRKLAAHRLCIGVSTLYRKLEDYENTGQEK